MKVFRLALAASFALTSFATPAQDIQERVIKVGHLVQPGHPISLGTQRLAELVAAKSGGKMQIKEYGASVLGPDTQQISALQGGVQEAVLPSTTVLAPIVKEFSLIDLPFSLKTPEQADALLQGAFGTALLQKLPEKGLIGLGYWETGFRNFTNSRKPIMSAEDVRGLKIRVLANPLFVESFSALGANPVPMAFGEVYGALESKAIDAQENPYGIVLSSKFYEVQKYLSVTNHVYTPNIFLVSKKFWDRLSPAEQKILQDAVAEAGAYQRKLSRENDAAARKELESRGMQINEVPPAATARMRELTQPVAEKFTATYDPALVRLYRAEMQKMQAGSR